MERYHGTESTQVAISARISLPPAVVLGLVLSGPGSSMPVAKLSQGIFHPPIFVSRRALLATMASNWYRDQKKTHFGPQKNHIIEEPDDTGGIIEGLWDCSPVQLGTGLDQQT